MRASVLHDPALVKRAGQFVWLSIDSDKPGNAAISEKLAAEGVPVFAILDSATGKVVLSWYGSATASQLAALADDGARVISGGASGPEAILARADEANARKNFKDAAAFYEQALKAGGEKWPKRQRVLESLVMARMFAHETAECAGTALREAPTMARDRSFVNVVYFGLECSKAGTEQSRGMEKLAEEAVKIPGVLSDDTSQLYCSLAVRYREEKDEAAATRAANSWVAYLRSELGKARTPEAKLALDLQLATAANVLRKPDIALPEIERAEREMPNEYMPPRTLAGLLANMGRFDEAMNACGRALTRANGDAKLRTYLTCGNIAVRKGDKAAAKKMLEEGVAYGRTLPEGAGRRTIEALQNTLGRI